MSRGVKWFDTKYGKVGFYFDESVIREVNKSRETGITSKEIAKNTGIKVDTVRKTLFKFNKLNRVFYLQPQVEYGRGRGHKIWRLIKYATTTQKQKANKVSSKGSKVRKKG